MSKLRNLTFVFSILVFLTQIAHAQNADPAQAPSSAAERHGKYVQLNRQILARHGDKGSGAWNDSQEKLEATTERLHKMIGDEIGRVLASSAPSEKTISDAIAKLQGEFSLSTWDPDMNTPSAKLLNVNGVPTLAVAYVIVRGGDAVPDTRAYLEFYDRASGDWERKASAPTNADFQLSTFYVARINSGVPGEAWFLAWGVPINSSRATKNLRLYSFDGIKVRTVWNRDGLDYGKVTVKPDSVTLEYEDDTLPNGTAHEVLRVTPNGLE